MSVAPDLEPPRGPDGRPLLRAEAKALDLGISVVTLWRRVTSGIYRAPTYHGSCAWFAADPAERAIVVPRKPRLRRPHRKNRPPE